MSRCLFSVQGLPVMFVNFCRRMPNAPITFDLVDYDHVAIEYSKEKNKNFNGHISYNRINALRFKPYQFYDMIWSAGMFDYFKDKHFVFLITKYINCLAEDGEFIIGNFTNNPSHKLMVNVSEWILNLRSEEDLFRLASEAGIRDELVSVEKETLGINLFLRIKMNSMLKCCHSITFQNYISGDEIIQECRR